LSIPQPNQQGSITVVTTALDPISQALVQVQNPRGGLDPIRVDASSSNPNLQLGTSTVTIDSLSSLVLPSGSFNANAISFQLADFGEGDITLMTAAPFSFVPSNTVHVRRAAGIAISVQPMARDLVGNIFVTFTPPLANGASFTLTSSDPSKARITADPSLNGQASLTFHSGASAFVEVLDDTGSVSITASSPGYDPVTTPLSIFPLTGGLFDISSRPLQNASLSVGGSVTAQIYLYPDFPLIYPYTWELRAGAAPIEMRLETLDNTIASPGGATGTFGPGGIAKLAVQIKALSFGTAIFALHLAGPVPLPLKPGSLTVNVFGQQLFLGPVTVGSNLMTQLPFSAPGPVLKSPFTVTITSSDPSRILLSPDTRTPGQPSITVTSPFNSVYVQSLVNAGFVDVTATSDGYQSGRATIRSVPSGFAWASPAVTLGQGNAANVTLAAYALDPGNLTPMARQAARPGLSGSLALQNSNASVVSLSTDNIPLGSFDSTAISLTPVTRGDAQIAITQPPGFIQPVGHASLNVKVLSPSIELSAPPLGRNMQVALAFGLKTPPGQSTNPPVTITSGDPSKLLISASDSVIGSASATILSRPADGYPTVYLQALDGPADVKIVASSPGFADSSIIVPILASSVVLSSYYPFPTQGIEMNTQQDPQTINIATIALQDSALYNAGAASGVLRAGLDPIPVSIRSSNPSVAAAVNNPILNSLTGQAAFQLKALAPGGTYLSVVEPPGFVAPPPGYARSLHVSVQGPSFAIPDVVLGQDLQVATTLAVLSGAAILPDDVDVSISSSDASKLLISTDPAAIGTGSLSIHFFKNTQSSRPIYLQALDQAGTVSVQITASGYGSSSANVTLAPTTFIADQSSFSGAIPNSNLTFRLRPVPSTTPISFYSGLNYTFRPGLASFTIGASISDPSVATISNPALTVSSGSSELDLSIQTISAGTATINFSVPDPYVAPPGITVNVQGGRLTLSSLTVVGKDLQDQLFISGDNLFRDSVTVTVTSSDPSRLLISSSPAIPGQASASVVNRPGQQLSVFVQALAASGTVKVTASSPGYQTTESQIQLTASSVILFNQPTQAPLTTVSPAVPFEARLAPYPQNISSVVQALRAGASPVSVQVSLSDTHVGSVTPTQVFFNLGDSRQLFSFQPLAAGSTLVSLSVPSGFVDPLSLRQVLLTVIAPRLTSPASTKTIKVR
jgi:hypothetical protein